MGADVAGWNDFPFLHLIDRMTPAITHKMVSRATRNPPRRCRRNQYFVDVDIFRVILKLLRDHGADMCAGDGAGWVERPQYLPRPFNGDARGCGGGEAENLN